MSFISSFKLILSTSAVVALTVCFAADANAQQRGFRIGNVFQAGGGQGVRIGGNRAGMHFGGGQGTSIGTQNFGMRFGNGQGARFGGSNYGMQFGGQQGTQIGRIQTTPTVAPGTYYYGDVQNGNLAQPMARQPIGQQPVPRVRAFQVNPSMIPSRAASPSTGVVQAQANLAIEAPRDPSLAAPLQTTPDPSKTQTDIARRPASNATSAPAATSAPVATETSTNNPPGLIRLRHPATATSDLNYQLNGSKLKLSPGETLIMTTGKEWKLVFSAGESFGDREAVISEAGNYAFEQTSDEGWILVNDEPEETLPSEVKLEAPDGPSILDLEPVLEETTIDDVTESETGSTGFGIEQ